jgi:hypothetical protein
VGSSTEPDWSGPGLGEPERRVVSEICRLADGLPLAVELAAAHVRALSVPAIRDAMADRLRFLAARDARPAAPHRPLAASLDCTAELVGALPGEHWRMSATSRWLSSFNAGGPPWALSVSTSWNGP